MNDVYDRAVEFLSENPEAIYDAWSAPLETPGGCLFLYATKTGAIKNDCGCLTQIRASKYKMAETQDLSDRIRNDARIPLDPADVMANDLPIFAEWQRILDAELDRQVEELEDDDGVYYLVREIEDAK